MWNNSFHYIKLKITLILHFPYMHFLNDFYYEIGLDNIKLGDELGWNIDDGYIDLSFSSQLASDGTPCLVIDYKIAPRYDFRNLR